MNENPIKKILILAANPIDTVRLSLEREVEEIRTTLQLSANRDRFAIEPRGAVRPNELQNYMYDVKPWIVHFSGHGLGGATADRETASSRKFTVISEPDSPPEGLVFEDENGRSILVSGTALANLCALFSKQVQCVVLNSCYSIEQAQEIVKYIPYVVGMKREIGDIAARKFSEGFYRAIWDDRSIEEAFASGKSSIELNGIPEDWKPVLLTRSIAATVVDDNQISDPIPSISTGGNIRMSEGRRGRLEQERARLESEYNLSIERLKPLRSAYIIETDPSTRFRLEKQIEQAEAEIKELERKLESIEEELNSSSEDSIELDEISEKLTPILPPRDLPKRGQIETLDIPIVENSGSFYIVRSRLEKRSCEEILKPGRLIRIKSPDKMGKSFMMSRVLDYVKQNGYRTAIIDLRAANQEIFTDINLFLKWLCAMVCDRLNIDRDPEENWKKFLGANPNCTKFFENYFLSITEQPLAIAFDNFDRIFEYPNIETDFCGLLRGWYEKVHPSNVWGNLRQVIVYSQESYAIKDINQSPLNVGFGVELDELNSAELLVLANAYKLSWTNQEIEKLMSSIGGHPYLAQLAFDRVVHREISLDELLVTAPTEEGIYGDFLSERLQHLEENPLLVESMRKVVNSDRPIRLGSKETFKLDSMGLIKRQGSDVLSRSNLYRLYFKDRLRE